MLNFGLGLYSEVAAGAGLASSVGAGSTGFPAVSSVVTGDGSTAAGAGAAASVSIGSSVVAETDKNEALIKTRII